MGKRIGEKVEKKKLRKMKMKMEINEREKRRVVLHPCLGMSKKFVPASIRG